jgi:thiol-disulfide isomerase/thioredoxin
MREKDVNRSAKDGRETSRATILIATLLAAIAGFGTIYLSFSPSDNGRLPGASKGMRQAGTATSGPLAGLNKGAMAAFVVKGEPEALPDVTFAGPDGGEKKLSDRKGKVVLLNLWATWCIPCREEMPMLDKLEAELGGKDFEVVAINTERGGADKAKRFLADTGVKHLRLYTDPTGKLFSTVKAVGMPTTLLIDSEGKEMGRLVGPADWDSPEALALIKKAIAASRHVS